MSADVNFGDSTAFGRGAPAADISLAARVVRSVVAITGISLLSVLVFLHPPAVDRGVLLSLGLAMLAADMLFSVTLPAGARYTVSATFLFFAFLSGGGVAAAALAAVVQGLGWIFRRVRGAEDRTPLFTLFEIGETCLAVVGGALVVEMLTHRPALTVPILVKPIAALVEFAAGYFLVSTLISSIFVTARRGFSELAEQLWPNSTLWLAISLVTNIPMAIILKLMIPSLGYVVATIVVFAVVAGFVHTARLNVRLREANTDLQGLNRIGAKINQSLNVGDIFAVLAHESRRTFRWDGLSVGLLEGGNDMLFMTMAGAGKIVQRHQPRRLGSVARSIATGELIVEDRSALSTVLVEERDPKRHWRSRVVVPLKVGHERIGALVLHSFRRDAFPRARQDLLRTVASQVATAIRNAQLYEGQQRANQERDEFLSLVTHEIKNPLTSITGYSELAEDAVTTGDKESLLEAVGVIRSETRKILRLTEDLLDASRARAGKFSMSPQEGVDLAALVRDAAAKYERTANQKISTVIAPEFPPLLADPVRLAQVVENLVSNALKYSSDSGEVRIELQCEAADAVLKVSDSGIGIPQADLDRIFDRFYRVEEDGRSIKGTGLGLFITREIVRAHGGTITVQSEQGVGSVFTVRLPIRAKI